MRKSMMRILTLTKRNMLETMRDPLSLVFTIGMPLVMEILFYAIFHNLTDQFDMRYLAPGIVAFSQAFLTLFTGLLLAVDRNTSFLTRLYVSEAKSYEFILGYAFAVLPIALVQSVLFFVVGGLFDTSLFGVGMVYGILLSLVTALFFIALGILFGSLCNEKSIGGVSSIAIVGQSVLSCMWFPTTGLSEGFMTAMRVLPFKNAALALQNALLGNNAFVDLGLPVLIVLAYAVAVMIAAILCFRSRMSAR